MPELPEVETTRLGITPWIQDQVVTGAVVRRSKLRWPVPDLHSLLTGKTITNVQRRAKYLLLHCSNTGTLMIHLGMSGSLRILPSKTPSQKHDHIDLLFGEHCLRMRDPRRFGAMLWSRQPFEHPLLKSLGPEPLSHEFNLDYLWHQTRERTTPIKSLLMNGKVVTGVGNIYATEALFVAGIRPDRACRRISRQRLDKLVQAVKHILTLAIAKGGSTLRDFQQEDGKPGYFQHDLKVYGRTGSPCRQCGHTIKTMPVGQRASAYCPNCQR